MKIRSYQLFILTLAFMLSACAQFGLQKPQSTEDRLRYAQSQVSAAYRTIGDLKAKRAITAAEGARYFQRVERVEEGLASADVVLRTQGDAGGKVSEHIAGLLASLVAVQNELKTR